MNHVISKYRQRRARRPATRALLTATLVLWMLDPSGLDRTACAIPSAAASPGSQPNIILIMADDLSYHALATNGGSTYVTPRLDEFATRGVRFEHCYSQPLCSPSHTQIVSGKYNYRNYFEFGYMSDQTTFADVLGAAGYTSCVVGKWQFHKSQYNGCYPDELGFDEHCVIGLGGDNSLFWDPGITQNGVLIPTDENDFGPDIHRDFVLDFITEQQAGPFFVFYAMGLVHSPLVVTPDSPPSTDTNEEMFSDMVTYMDKIVGQIIDKVDELGLAQDTIILFTADNGCDYGIEMEWNGTVYTGHKRHPDDLGNRVPLIANWEGQTSSGTTTDALVDFTDFLPTLAAAAGTSLPDGEAFDGRSFLPQIIGETGDPRTWAYSWYDAMTQVEYAFVRFARDQRWKLYDDERLYDVPNDIHEQTPVPPGASPEADAARDFLQIAMEEAESGLAPGDLNADRAVDTTDLLSLLERWGPCVGWCREDLDGDGIVAISDLLILLSNWGDALPGT